MKITLLFLVLIMISGCSVKGNKFKPDFNTVNELKDNNLKSMTIERDTLNGDNIEKVSLRGANMMSPYGGSFSKYLEISLEKQLKQSSLYNKNSNIKISTTLLKNDVDILGFTVGEADLSANFIVKIDDKKVYEKIQTIHY